MLGQRDSEVREFIMLAGEWVKGWIMESQVIGSLRRRIRAQIRKKKRGCRIVWNRYSQSKRAGRKEVVVRVRSDWSSDYKGGAVLGGGCGHWCVPCLEIYTCPQVTFYSHLQLPKEPAYTCSQSEQTYTSHVLGGEMRARVHLWPSTEEHLGSLIAGCPNVHEKCVPYSS